MTNQVRIEKIGKRKKVFGELDIPTEFIEKVMKRTGYIRHYKNGLYTGDWVKNVSHKKRFHIVLTETGIELHLDRTIDGMHIVADYTRMLTLERRTIREAYKYIDPNWKPMHLNEKLDHQKRYPTAPNALELQKNHKTTVYRPTFWENLSWRIKRIIKKLI